MEPLGRPLGNPDGSLIGPLGKPLGNCSPLPEGSDGKIEGMDPEGKPLISLGNMEPWWSEGISEGMEPGKPEGMPPDTELGMSPEGKPLIPLGTSLGKPLKPLGW